MKHKCFKMLQQLYHFVKTKLCRSFMLTLWIEVFTDLENTLMTAHSYSVLSQLPELLKMFSFGPYAGELVRDRYTTRAAVRDSKW